MLLPRTRALKCLALLGGALLTAGIASAQSESAADKALIDALIKKGVITSDEAQQIQTEVKQSQSQEKTVVSGKMYIDVSDISAKNAAGATIDPSGFGTDVKRFYFGVTHQFDGVWSANINTDSAYSSATGATSVFIKTAYVQAKLSPEAIVQVGSANMPWIPFDEDTYGFRYVENTLIDRLHFGNSADWGVHFLGTSNIFSYNVAVVNGGGYKNPTRSKSADVEGRLSAEPVKGLTFAIGGYNGKLGKDSNTNSAMHTATRLDGLAAYNCTQFGLGAEYYSENDWGFTASASEDKSDGYAFTGRYTISGPFSAFGRWDEDKPSKTLHPGEKEDYFNVGFQYVAIKGVNLALVYKNDRIHNPASASQMTKYDEFGMFSQIAF